MTRSMVLSPIILPVVELPAVALAPGQRAVRALFMPSFHPRVLVTVLVAPAQALLTLDIGEASGRARFVLDPGRGAELLREVDVLDRGDLAAAADCGLDGMIAQGEVLDAGEVFCFSAWSPRRGSPQHTYLAALQRVALESADAARDLRCRVALEHVHGYLDLGLPLRDDRGRPRRVRIFGMLSYPPSPELVSAIEALAGSGDPLLLDLSNLGKMGTALFPLFRRLTERPAPTVYWASAVARGQLAEMGVAADRVFAALEDAVAALERPGP